VGGERVSTSDGAGSVIAGIVLAAGSSSRLGGETPKQLLVLNGRPLVQHAVDTVAEAGLDPIVVVLGHRAEDVERALVLPSNARTVRNALFATGQASSLVAGLDALGPEVSAAVIVLGDQPELPAEHVCRLVDAYRTARRPIVRARYRDGVPGHPVVLGREVWPRVRELLGDTGARDLIERDPGLVAEVVFDAPAPEDIDTMANYRAALARADRQGRGGGS